MHHDYDEITDEARLVGTFTVVEVALESGDTAWHPTSTKKVLRAGAKGGTVRYEVSRAVSGAIVRVDGIAGPGVFESLAS